MQGNKIVPFSEHCVDTDKHNQVWCRQQNLRNG